MRVILLDWIFENKEDMFSLLTEDTENYAFSDQQMQRIEENLLLRSVDELPEISQKTIKEIEEPDPFVRTLLEEPDTYELWNSVDRQKKENQPDTILDQEELQHYIGIHTFFQYQQEQEEQEEKEELELLIVNAKPDSCLEEKNCKKLSLYLNTANTKQDRSSYIQCAILPEADKYPQAVKVIADIFQQYNIPLLLQASLQKKYGPEVFAKEGTAMWHALGEKLVDKNSPEEKNTLLCYPNLSSAYGECYTGAAYVTAACLCMGAEQMADTQLPRELYKYSEETQSEIEYDPYGCMLIGNGSTMYIKDFNTLEGKRIHVL